MKNKKQINAKGTPVAGKTEGRMSLDELESILSQEIRGLRDLLKEVEEARIAAGDMSEQTAAYYNQESRFKTSNLVLKLSAERIKLQQVRANFGSE